MHRLKKIIFLLMKFIGFEILTKKQKRVLNKYNPKSNNDLDSIIFFTTHKAASNFTNHVLKEIEQSSEFVLYDYGALIGSLSEKLSITNKFEEYLNENSNTLFHLHGEIYGPQRMPLNFEGINDYKKIFFLRDPRDVLVSAYYSFGFNHVEPDSSTLLDTFLEERKKIQDQNIDEYVLQQANKWIKPMYSDYKKLRQKTSQNTLYLKYNDYVQDTVGFINSIFNFAGLENKELAERLSLSANPITKIEQKDMHKRSGKNNQWKTHLTQSTQDKLNVELKHILEYWEFI
jgi:hypothetical protein